MDLPNWVRNKQKAFQYILGGLFLYAKAQGLNRSEAIRRLINEAD